MTTADQLALVEAHLGGEAKALALAEAGLVQGWIKTRRMLVVVEPRAPAQGHRALLVLSSASYPVSSSADLTLERAVAIDAGFSCDIDSGGDSAVLLKVGGDLMFEMLPGYHTQNLVAEIYKQTEAAGKKGAGQETAGSTPSWLSKFLSKKDKGRSSSRKTMFTKSILTIMFFLQILSQVLELKSLHWRSGPPAPSLPSSMTWPLRLNSNNSSNKARTAQNRR